MKQRCVCLLAPLLVVFGCGGNVTGDGDDDGDDDNPAVSIAVSPPDAVLTVDNGVPATQGYTAIATLRDGSTLDVTAMAAWDSEYDTIASFAAESAVLTATGARGGVTEVRASFDGVVGAAPVVVKVATIRVDPSAPPNAADRFGAAAEDPARAPTVAYPADRTMVPPNLGDFEVHWTAAAGTDVFEVALTSEFVDVRVYTGPTTPASFATLSADEWRVAGDSERSGSVQLAVRGLSFNDPATAGTSSPITVEVGPDDVRGGIYYWASTARGLYRHDFGNPEEAAQPFYTPNESGGRCVACHALSRDGAHMVVTYEGGDGPAAVLDVATREPLFADDGTVLRSNFSSFSPDGLTFLANYRGVLTLRETATGAVVQTVPTGMNTTHPDFSPAGDQIVWVSKSGLSDWGLSGGGQLYVQSFVDGVFGAPQLLVDVPGPGLRAYYPTYSPDGEWVLYNVSSEDAYDDGSAEIYVVRADGSTPPLKVASANVAGGLTNSWARWAPFEQLLDGATTEPMFWFTISSKRAFGVRKPLNAVPQIWMAPFFPNRALIGDDPSLPMFRLPFQDLGTSNHIAQWTEQIVTVN